MYLSTLEVDFGSNINLTHLDEHQSKPQYGLWSVCGAVVCVLECGVSLLQRI